MQPLRAAGSVPAVLGLVLLLGGPSRGAEPAALAEVLLLDRAPVSGTFVGLTADTLTVRPGTDATASAVDLPLAGVRDLAFPAEPAKPPALDRLRVTLTSGEELVADSWGPAPDGLKLASPSFGELRVPMEAVRTLVPVPAKASVCHDPSDEVTPRPGTDIVRLTGGDEVRGTVAEARPQGLVVELERGRQRTVAWADLHVALLDNPPVAAPDRPFAEVGTHAGDLLEAAGALTGDAGKGLALTLRAHASLAVRVPLAAVRAVRWRGGRCVDALRLPRTDTYTPLHTDPPEILTAKFTRRDRGPRVGRRPSACPLRLGGVVYRHGLAVSSGSESRIALGGGFKTFQTLFGIDDEVHEEPSQIEGRGNVDARVLGDGRVLWEAKGVTGRDKPRTVGPLDVAGVKELVLVVDYGEESDWLDRATWAEPLLLR